MSTKIPSKLENNIHKQKIRSLSVSANSQLLAAASFDSTCSVWSTSTWKMICDPLQQPDFCSCCAFDFHHDDDSISSSSSSSSSSEKRFISKNLAVASSKGGIVLYSFDEALILQQEQEQEQKNNNNENENDDNNNKNSNSNEKNQQCQEKKVPTVFPLSAGGVYCVCLTFSKQTKELAAGFYDNTCKVFSSPETTKNFQVLEHASYVTCCVFVESQQSQQPQQQQEMSLITGEENSLITIWSRRCDSGSSSEGETVGKSISSNYQKLTVLRGEHGGSIHSLSLSPDMKTLASVSDDTCKLWDLASKTCKATVGRNNNNINLLELAKSEKEEQGENQNNSAAQNILSEGIQNKEQEDSHNNSVDTNRMIQRCVAFSPSKNEKNSSVFLCSSMKDLIFLWNPITAELLTINKESQEQQGGGIKRPCLVGHFGNEIFSLAFVNRSNNNNNNSSQEQEQKITENEQETTVTEQEIEVCDKSVAVSATSTTTTNQGNNNQLILVSGDETGQIRLWDLSNVVVSKVFKRM